MIVFLYAAFVVFGFVGISAYGSADSAIHQGYAALVILTSFASLIGAAICTRLDHIRKAIERADENSWKIGHAQWRELREPGNKDPEPVGTSAEK